MSNFVRINTVHPKRSIYHHSIIKMLILDQLKERSQSWETFVFKVLNPHLNIRKRSHHFHLESRPTSPLENPDVVHLNEDVSEPNSLQETPSSLVSTEFVPFS